jgi:hypothetical protein
MASAENYRAVGYIERRPRPLSVNDWIQFALGHSNLVRMPPIEITNPITRERIEVMPSASFWVKDAEVAVGTMTMKQEDEIVFVSGIHPQVDQVVADACAALEAEFVPLTERTDTVKIDRWIEQLSTENFAWAHEKLVSFGQAALQRLLEIMDGKATIPLGESPKETLSNWDEVLVDLGQRYPDLFLEAVQKGNRLNNSSIVWALGALDDERAIDALGKALAAENEDARWIAAHQLRERGWGGTDRIGVYLGLQRPAADKRVVESLVRAVQDPSELVRSEASDALCEFGDSRALEPLRTLLADPVVAGDPVLSERMSNAIQRIEADAKEAENGVG